MREGEKEEKIRKGVKIKGRGRKGGVGEEEHRPLYDWYVDHSGLPCKPRQIEFAKLSISNNIMGKRYLKALVDNGEVDGWDDPRVATISGMRRRGYTKEALKDFCNRVGVSKANNRVDVQLLEHCVREDLITKSKMVMAVLDPLKVVITNYPENEEELLEIENNPKNPDLGKRQVAFSREIYIEKEDFMENAPSKYFRLTEGREVRLKGAYFIKCNEVIKDENGNIIELRCTYDPETKSGSGFTGRKVKGTIHWVSIKHSYKFEARLYDYLVVDDAECEHGIRKTDNSLTILKECYGEASLKDATKDDRFQFIRNAYFCLDHKLSSDENKVFGRIVSLKSSFKLKG